MYRNNAALKKFNKNTVLEGDTVININYYATNKPTWLTLYQKRGTDRSPNIATSRVRCLQSGIRYIRIAIKHMATPQKFSMSIPANVRYLAGKSSQAITNAAIP